ncbi:MAG: DUF3604 domain-containing protein [Nanoarchaeota archaeon]|nr:DUF3604 domain-containing protein [Nanoarchaeota archaeon]
MLDIFMIWIFVSETNAPFQTKYSDYKKRYKQFQNDIIIFLGLEWVSNDFYSHHVVLFNNILDFTSLRTFDLINSTPDLWNFLRNKESLTIAAHPTTKICRFSECGVWSNNDDNRVLAEIFSGYAGSAECFGCPYDSSENSPNYLRNAWAKGIKVGVTSISDAFIPGTTMPMPMTSSVPNLGGGLTAVIVSDNSKEAVWDALKSRHTYATTGDRIILYFDINGFLPGDIISTNQALNISVEVVGTATIANLELFKFHDDKYELFASTSSDDEFASMIIQDSVVLNNSFYYVRILQTNGEVAWSSPIWVEG